MQKFPDGIFRGKTIFSNTFQVFDSGQDRTSSLSLLNFSDGRLVGDGVSIPLLCADLLWTQTDPAASTVQGPFDRLDTEVRFCHETAMVLVEVEKNGPILRNDENDDQLEGIFGVSFFFQRIRAFSKGTTWCIEIPQPRGYPDRAQRLTSELTISGMASRCRNCQHCVLWRLNFESYKYV